MNPKHSKLQHQQEQETTQQAGQSQEQNAGKDFDSVEEMLRYDAQQVSVPPALTKRLQESVAKEPNQRSWWQRLFGPGN